MHVDQLSRALAPLVEVRVHCFGGPRPSPLVEAAYQPWEAIPGTPLHAGALRALSVDLLMAAGVEGCDVAHSHTWYANLGGHLASLLHGIPHVVTCHSLEPLRPWKAEQLGGGYEVSRFCERVALEGAAAVVAVSESMRHDVLRVYPDLDPERVRVIHNGIDAAGFAAPPAPGLLARLGLDPARPTVVFVGRITRQKGLGHLLRAAPALDPSAQLLLLASAPDTPAQGREVGVRVEELTRAGRRVVWVEEPLSRTDLAGALSAASVFVCPSVYEPFGLVNLEAMAAALPVVASAVGGIPEIVEDGTTGLLVPFEASSGADAEPGDPDALAADLARAVNRLLAEPDLASRMGRAGRQRVLERFTWESVAAQTAALYRSLVD